MHNEELRNLFLSANIIKETKPSKMRWAGHVANMAEEKRVYKEWVGKPEGKRPLGRTRHRWQYVITEIG
jgi:hypothetical protein